ncbi:porin family protein [Persicobacter psychrovividus]|uniref:Outer membrane protein beta-barrel domain-containing protein n=1 Tax=Persicobacter psychrovividus TaxID=387638 RepID=A0ABM7VHD8_9BACT|nr:hypothetical protein PEPS_26620 [Persicobacter psychrovividus]
MKKLSVLFVALMMFVGLQAQAQIHVIPAVGMTVSKPNHDMFSAQAGYRFGASVRIGDKFFVQPGLFYAKYTAKVDVPNSAMAKQAFEGVSFDQKGWEIPVLVGYNFINSDMFKFRAYAGPQVGFGYKGSLSHGLGAFDTESTQWSVKAGLGVDVLFFTLDADYGWGLNDAFKATEAFNHNSYKNRTFNVTLGIRI